MHSWAFSVTIELEPSCPEAFIFQDSPSVLIKEQIAAIYCGPARLSICHWLFSLQHGQAPSILRFAHEEAQGSWPGPWLSGPCLGTSRSQTEPGRRSGRCMHLRAGLFKRRWQPFMSPFQQCFLNFLRRIFQKCVKIVYPPAFLKSKILSNSSAPACHMLRVDVSSRLFCEDACMWRCARPACEMHFFPPIPVGEV